MQSIKFCICEFLLIILLSDVNGYSDVRLETDWTPTEQIKFYPRKSGKSAFRDSDDERARQRFHVFDSNQLGEPDRTGLVSAYDQAEQNDAAPNIESGSENGFKRNGDKPIESGQPDEKQLNKKEQDHVLDALMGNLLNDLSQQNKSVQDERSLVHNQHLIWFLIAKIIPTTSKLNQFLCSANGSSSDQLCTSFNHLHLLVGKSKRSSSNDETFRKARLIEDLSNQFDDLNRHSFGRRPSDPALGQMHDNFDKKFDIKLNHKFSNQFDHRNFAQRAFNHYDPNKRDFESLPPSFDQSPVRADFEANLETKKSANRYHLNRLMNSKSIYKHHQRLKRTVDTVLDQLAGKNATPEHRISRRSVDNEIKYPDIQQFGG